MDSTPVDGQVALDAPTTVVPVCHRVLRQVGRLLAPVPQRPEVRVTRCVPPGKVCLRESRPNNSSPDRRHRHGPPIIVARPSGSPLSARLFCLTTDEDRDSIVNQWRRYRSIGVTVVIASALFTVYTIRLFTTSQQTMYNFYVALGIATITFIELGSAVYQSVTRLHDPSPLVHAAKLASLASALTAMTLVQIVVRQLGERDTYGTTIDPAADGWGGLFFGCLALLVGVGMVIYSTYRLHHPDRPSPTAQLDASTESAAPDLSSAKPHGTPAFTTEKKASPCQF